MLQERFTKNVHVYAFTYSLVMVKHWIIQVELRFWLHFLDNPPNICSKRYTNIINGNHACSHKYSCISTDICQQIQSSICQRFFHDWNLLSRGERQFEDQFYSLKWWNFPIWLFIVFVYSIQNLRTCHSNQWSKNGNSRNYATN